MLSSRIFILAVAMMTMSSTIAIAQPNLLSHRVIAQNPTSLPRANNSQPRGWLKDLNLTSKQLQEIKQIRHQSQKQIAEKAQLVRQGQQELHNLLAGGVSEKQVRDKYNQIQLVKQQLADAQFENTLAIRKILNPEQRQKFADHLYKPHSTP